MSPESTFDRQSSSQNAFVGRERELAELRAGLDDVSASHGRLFLLSGEPGIGKTRLAEEISRRGRARDTRGVGPMLGGWRCSGVLAVHPDTPSMR
jgi:transcriptional regulator with AAA-type ATPase domain